MTNQVNRRGRPAGIPRDGLYGRGVKTELLRVPVGKKDLTVALLNDLPDLVRLWKAESKQTRDWTKFNQFIELIEDIYPELFESSVDE